MTHRPLENPEVALAISYAPAPLQTALGTILTLDDSLGSVLRATGQPMLAQIRLAWWREQLAALDNGAAPAMPVLQAVERDLIGRGVAGALLAEMATGWERLATADQLEDATLDAYAEERGGILFRSIALATGGVTPDGLAEAGQGWALADLARHLSDGTAAERSRRLAIQRLEAGPRRWPKALRSLGALALIARMDAAMPLNQPIRRGAPGRVARMAMMRLTGR